MLERLADAVGGGASAIIMQNVATGVGRTAYVRAPDHLWKDYFGHYARRNVLLKHGARMRTEQTATDQDFMSKSEFRTREYYNDFLLRNGMNAVLMVTVWRGGDNLCALNVTRGPHQPEFDAPEKALAATLAPHLSRAFAASLRLEQANAWKGLSEAVLEALPNGVVVLDEDGRLLFANARAHDWAVAYNGLRLADSGISAICNPAAGALRRAVSGAIDAGSGAALAVVRRLLSIVVVPVSDRSPWLVVCRPRALVLITDPDAVTPPPATRLRSLFGLTQSEAAFARQLLAGDSVQQAAEHLGIGIATARQHLSRTMAKTETSRQGDLIRVLALTTGLGF